MANLICKTVGHSFGNWKYTDLSHPIFCDKVRKCKICGAKEEKLEHDWEAWAYVSADNCWQERHCKRCKEYEKKENHWQTNLRYASDEVCHFGNLCRRCDKLISENKAYEKHVWKMEYTNEEKTIRKQTCERCKESFEEQSIKYEVSKYCPLCGGSGTWIPPSDIHGVTLEGPEDTCSGCDGTGGKHQVEEVKWELIAPAK